MRAKGWQAIILGLGMLSGLLTGCAGNECLENHSALPLAYFYSYQTRQRVSIQNLEIFGIGAPGDSILYEPQTLQAAYLPFRIWQDTTRYVFVYQSLAERDEEGQIVVSAPTDTVTFIYKPTEWFVSPACGAMYFYDMKEVRHSDFLIDSIAYNPLITNENSENIQIFFKE